MSIRATLIIVLKVLELILDHLVSGASSSREQAAAFKGDVAHHRAEHIRALQQGE